MEEKYYIEKNVFKREDQNYDFLRQKGLQYIESLASKIWTDYNVHDPGITILEALCYAITELGYRTDFSITDLMADAKGNINKDQAFFTAKDILTSEPLTIDDYRKLLIDIDGVSNAWLFPWRDDDLNLVGEPMQEVAIYAECKKDRLTYTPTEHSIKLRGLYNVVVDLDETDEFGDLNTGTLPWQFAVPELINIKMELRFPNWDETDKVDYDFISTADPASLQNINVAFADDTWIVKFDLTSGSDTKSVTFSSSVLSKKDVSGIASFITAQFNDVTQAVSLFGLYQKKIKRVLGILSNVKSTLHAHRNLCEDFVKIKNICTQDIAFCADIEVKTDADIEEIYAKVLFLIEDYFDPEIKFYALKELMDEGLSADQIFEGPVLKHGFIKTDELRNAQIRKKIFVSDIINFIADIEGVLSVKNALLTKYDRSGKPVLPSERWCMEIEGDCKPVLNINRSKVLFFKGKLPFKPKLDETEDTLLYLHGLNKRNKLKGTAGDLVLPKGEYHDLQDYLSVQYEFPITYGIGEAGLPSTAAPLRKAQARQLKAYLMFYDQLLANFFSQLKHAGKLFSINDDVNQTYFAQFLADINGMDELYVDASDLEKSFSKPQTTDTDTVKKIHSQLLEDSGTFHDRRNRFLDHLIARFAESFNDYVLMLYTYQDADQYAGIEEDKLLKDKVCFLKDYPVISRERGKAFNYLQPSWNTANVSGLEKRVSRLAGIADFSTRFLFCMRNIEIQKDAAGKFFFEVKNEQGKAMIKSLQHYDSWKALNEIIHKLLDVAGNVAFYQDKDISASEYTFELWDAGSMPLAESGLIFPDAASRNEAIVQMAKAMSQTCPDEGMHLVEHLLLRPRFSPPVIANTEPEVLYKLFNVCLGENCNFCGEEDPYSFRISLILPYWHERFQSIEFRRYFEDMVRTEAPAHCMIKICWVNNTLMNKFELYFKEWLDALAAHEKDLLPKKTNEDRLRQAGNAMIDILNQLHSEYPEAQLHDCETSLTNPVLLGNTVLGTYKI